MSTIFISKEPETIQGLLAKMPGWHIVNEKSDPPKEWTLANGLGGFLHPWEVHHPDTGEVYIMMEVLAHPDEVVGVELSAEALGLVSEGTDEYDEHPVISSKGPKLH
jgi:hypothetical protein